jgi:predicted transcriptional regulator of viral defense system/very-short-patch-repair endonuclease
MPVAYEERTPPPDRHRPLLELATRQHGVVATRQLKDLGYNRASAARAAKVGRLERLHRGVYAVGHEDLSWNGHCMAALLACAPAVASHWTAAWLWGLLNTSPSRFHLTAPSRRHRRRDFTVHFAALQPEDVAAVNAIPLTSLARTHLDLAATAPNRLEAFLEGSEELNLFDLRQFESLLRRSPNHPGYAALRDALELYRPEPATLRSDLERDFRRLLRASAIPLPKTNFILGPYELDCYWPEQRFCVELDTFASHGSRRSFEADRRRERELRRLGVGVMRVTDRQLRSESGEVLEAVRRSLRL